MKQLMVSVSLFGLLASVALAQEPLSLKEAKSQQCQRNTSALLDELPNPTGKTGTLHILLCVATDGKRVLRIVCDPVSDRCISPQEDRRTAEQWLQQRERYIDFLRREGSAL